MLRSSDGWPLFVSFLLAFGCGGGGDGSEVSGRPVGNAGSGQTGGTGSITVGSGGSAGSPGSAQTCDGMIRGVLRDFDPDTHPDFQPANSDLPNHVAGKTAVEELGLVMPTLSAEFKPLYAANPTTGSQSTYGQSWFDMWFHDTPGVNLTIDFNLDFQDPDGDGIFTFGDGGGDPSDATCRPLPFFPIDDGSPTCDPPGADPCLLGNWPGYNNGLHNYHMTFELHSKFIYNKPGMVFTFSGDDDVWVFINNQLAVDIGGIHGCLKRAVNLDASAAALGLEAGGEYQLDFFWAERQASQSNFRIDTSIEFIDCGIDVPH